MQTLTLFIVWHKRARLNWLICRKRCGSVYLSSRLAAGLTWLSAVLLRLREELSLIVIQFLEEMTTLPSCLLHHHGTGNMISWDRRGHKKRKIMERFDELHKHSYPLWTKPPDKCLVAASSPGQGQGSLLVVHFIPMATQSEGRRIRHVVAEARKGDFKSRPKITGTPTCNALQQLLCDVP